jgi:uncharacterized protein YndB with AHSA1/START domain
MSEPNPTGTKPQTETRSIDLQIEIPASAQAIWEGLTDPELIGYWFAPEARVEPKVGGEYWVSWGGGMDMGMTISAWEPGKFLQLRSDMPLPDGSTATLLCDFTIEVEGGTAKLRLVNSGFSTDTSWDDEITNMTKGWTVFLHNLRNLVSHPSGVRPKGFMVTRKGAAPSISTESSWATSPTATPASPTPPTGPNPCPAKCSFSCRPTCSSAPRTSSTTAASPSWSRGTAPSPLSRCSSRPSAIPATSKHFAAAGPRGWSKLLHFKIRNGSQQRLTRDPRVPAVQG